MKERCVNRERQHRRPIKGSTVSNAFDIHKTFIEFLLTDCKATVQDLLRISGRIESSSLLSLTMKGILTWESWSKFLHIVCQRITVMKGSFHEKNFDSTNVLAQGKSCSPNETIN